jgi:hypothetical protein
MYDLDPTVHAISGAAEILGGLGLILPGLTRIMPVLTVWAAVGLAAVMLLAAVWHIGRGELTNIAMNLLVAAIMAFIAFRRATGNKIEPRASSAG